MWADTIVLIALYKPNMWAELHDIGIWAYLNEFLLIKIYVSSKNSKFRFLSIYSTDYDQTFIKKCF